MLWCRSVSTFSILSNEISLRRRYRIASPFYTNHMDVIVRRQRPGFASLVSCANLAHILVHSEVMCFQHIRWALMVTERQCTIARLEPPGLPCCSTGDKQRRWQVKLHVISKSHGRTGHRLLPVCAACQLQPPVLWLEATTLDYVNLSPHPGMNA